MKCNVAVIPGDGIGPDIVAEAIKVLKTIGEKFGHRFEYEYAIAGGCSIDKTGEALPAEERQTSFREMMEIALELAK